MKLLADYYYRPRTAKADLQQLRRQLAAEGAVSGATSGSRGQGSSTQPQEAELKAAQAGGDAIVDLGGKLAERSDTVKNLAALIYFSVPGVCLRERQVIASIVLPA